jgi:ATP-binding protein involved in chromosome partitioning
MAADERAVERAVRAVRDPELDLALDQTGMVRSVHTRRHRASVEIALPVTAWPNREELEARVALAARSVPGVEEVTVDLAVMSDAERATLRHQLRGEVMEADADSDEDPHDHGAHDHGAHDHGDDPAPPFLEPGSTTRVIGVSSGKGGVGKSSVTVNLAVALAQDGHSVGLLDADVYGFSVPKMLGTDHDPVILGDLVIPCRAQGVRCLSIGFFVEEAQPVIWRGPMLHKALQQFVGDAYWGEPDFLLVDMPPGTGDVTLSIAQVMPRAEVLVVTTPQAAAQRVAQRSAFAARKLKLAVRGVIENMSWFTGDDGRRYELFGSGGGRTLAEDLGVPLLGQIPLVPAIREGGDEGRPVVVAEPDSEAARAFADLAGRLDAMGPARVYRRELTLR